MSFAYSSLLPGSDPRHSPRSTRQSCRRLGRWPARERTPVRVVVRPGRAPGLGSLLEGVVEAKESGLAQTRPVKIAS